VTAAAVFGESAESAKLVTSIRIRIRIRPAAAATEVSFLQAVASPPTATDDQQDQTVSDFPASAMATDLLQTGSHR